MHTMPIANDWASVISLVVSIILTIAVFILSTIYSNKAELREKKYNTVTFASNQFNIIDTAMSEKISVEGFNTDFSYKYIDGNQKIEGYVYKILNSYATIGSASRHDLVDNEVIANLRKDAIISTWNDYKPYIKDYRKEKNKKDAWKDVEYLAVKMADIGS